MNAHRLYSAIQMTERALAHLRNVWEEQDGGFVKTKSTKQQIAELHHAEDQLKAALGAIAEARTTETPEEKPEDKK